MKKAIVFCVLAVTLAGCSANQIRVVELGPSGFINPFVPAITGGCLADLGNLEGAKVVFKDGECSIEMTGGGTE
jgi:hypothetical protein